MKDDETKNIVLLKDGFKELIESYPSMFDTFMKNEMRQLAAKEKHIDYKKLSQDILSYGFNFLERYDTPYRFLENLIAKEINIINSANDDQGKFLSNPMKVYNVSSFFTKSKIRDLGEKNFFEKTELKAFEILLKCEKSVEGIKKFLPKRFNKDITENQKSILLNAIKLFDIRNTIVSLFRNGFIKPLDYQSTVKLELKPKLEEGIGKRTKLRKQRLNEIAKSEKEINFELLRKYFKY